MIRPLSPAELRAARRAAAGACAALRRLAEMLADAEIPGGTAGGALTLEGRPLTLGALRLETEALLTSLGLEQPEGFELAPPPFSHPLVPSPPVLGSPVPGSPALRSSDGELLAPRPELAAVVDPPEDPQEEGPGEIRLRAGEPLLVHLYVRVRRVEGDDRPAPMASVARTFVAGEAPAPVARAHADLLAGIDRVHRRLALTDVAPKDLSPRLLAAHREGFALQDAFFSHLARRGYETPLTHPGSARGAVHEIGHGLGLSGLGKRREEPPVLRRGMEEAGKLTPGLLLALHPGLYDPPRGDRAGWAVRVGDTLLLGDRAPEVLTPVPYELDPADW